MQMSVDGYIAGPNGEMDFMEWNWDTELIKYTKKLTEPVDCIILGRKLAEGFIPYWSAVAANPEDPEFAAGKKFTDTSKIVFSKTLDKSDWDNTLIANGDLADEIIKLKKQDGDDIIAYGGAAFVSALIKQGLIDEYHLFINPTAIGKGMTIFHDLDSKQNLTLVKSASFDCGIVVLNYDNSKNLSKFTIQGTYSWPQAFKCGFE